LNKTGDVGADRVPIDPRQGRTLHLLPIQPYGFANAVYFGLNTFARVRHWPSHPPCPKHHMTAASDPTPPSETTHARKDSAATRRKSITPGNLICLDDGKRQIQDAASERVCPDAGAVWREMGPPADYPIDAATYAANGSELALKIGLGRKPEAPGLRASPKAKPTRRNRR